MPANDYVKYFTEQAVMYMNNPAAYRKERREAKQQQREKREQTKNIYTNRWLGVVPFAVKVFLKDKQQVR